MEKFWLRQKQAGYYSVRFKSDAGNFTAAELATIRGIAEKFGGGDVHVTSRQEISVTFIRAEKISAVEEVIAGGGLVPAAIGRGFKTVTACQGNAVCLSGNIDAAGISRALTARYAGRNFGRKIRIAVTGCSNNCMKVEAGDVGVKGGVEPNHIGERCVYCGGCAKICPTGAIKVDRAEKIWALERGLCTNCGRCARRCTAAISGEAGFIVYARGERISALIREEAALFKLVDETLEGMRDG